MPTDPALRHRISSTLLTLTDPDGEPLAEELVTIAQTRHAFGFGCTGFDFIGLANGEVTTTPDPNHGGASAASAAELVPLWLDLFDTATLPFYWRGFEPAPGRPDTARLRAIAQWFADRGVRVKGHPLMWHTMAPKWLLGLDTDEVERLQRERISREVAGFAGLVDTWDAINELVIMPVFTAEENAITQLARELGRIATARLAFTTARAANPQATLLLNDFDMSTGYECLIEGLLAAGVRIDALGLQSHMHQGYWGEEKTQRILERFARFGLPLHFTETTLLSGELMPDHIDDLNDYRVPAWPSTPEGEERQADEIVRHYRTLLSHPAVAATTYWGIADEGAWLGAPSGLVRADGTPKPAYHALRDLVRGVWWLPPTTMRTDASGHVRVAGWPGDYEVRQGPASTAFSVGNQPALTVRLGRPGQATRP